MVDSAVANGGGMSWFAENKNGANGKMASWRAVASCKGL